MEYNNQSVRRQDRTLDQQRAFEILRYGEYGVLSMQTEDGKGAYGVPISYVWDGANSLYIHCAPMGRKLSCIDACDRVSFCVVGRTNVVAEKFTTGYESIVLCCIAHHHLPSEERRRALGVFLEKYCHNHKEVGLTYAEKSFPRTEIIRLDILEISGKTKNLF